MVLTGQAKKDYQREYMRKRSKKRKNNGGSKAQGLTQYPRVSDQDFTKLMAHLPTCPNARVSKPGDADYEPQCETTKAFEGRPAVERTPEEAEMHVRAAMKALGDPKILAEFREGKTSAKRGKDIKTFFDLPLDVQQTIDTMSVVDGKMDQTIKANRTAIAIHYQHLFPDRYNSTGVV